MTNNNTCYWITPNHYITLVRCRALNNAPPLNKRWFLRERAWKSYDHVASEGHKRRAAVVTILLS